MSTYVQRQLSAFCAPGDNTDVVTFAPSIQLWAEQDVYPSKILKLADGKVLSNRVTIGSGSTAMPLPEAYSSTKRLAFFLTSNYGVKITTVSPDHPTSTVLTAIDANDQALFCFIGTVTSITLNTSLTAVDVQYFCYEYPDITLAASWQDGVETVGTVST